MSINELRVIERDGDKMEAASIKEALNGKSNDKYITPYTLSKILSSYDKGGVVNVVDLLPIGAQIAIGTIDPAYIPANWFVCDGRELSREAYADLFAVIGTSYGAGDGSTTFNLPDKRGRASVGYDSTQDEFNAIGKHIGEKTHKLIIEEMPKHNHPFPITGSDHHGTFFSNQWSNFRVYTGNDAVYDAGGDQPHNNIQPSEVDNWIIKAFDTEVELPSTALATVHQSYIDSKEAVYSSAYLNPIIASLLPLLSGKVTSKGTNYITYDNGFKLCWGSAVTNNLNGYFRQADVTFPITFDAPPIVIPTFHMSDGSIADARTTCSIFGKPGTTGASIRLGNPNAELTNRSVEVSYFAVGF